MYFYPAAMTPGCTTEACDFTSARAPLDGGGYAVLGISPDKPEKLAKFRDKEDLTITLLSDADQSVMAAYGAYGEKKMYGKTVQGVIRSTFVVGADGTARTGLAERQGHRARGPGTERTGSGRLSAMLPLAASSEPGAVAQLAEAHGLGPCQCGFESHRPHSGGRCTTGPPGPVDADSGAVNKGAACRLCSV